MAADATDFADALREMIADGVGDLFSAPSPASTGGFPPPASRPAYGSWNEEDRQYQEVRALCGKSTFPIKNKLKALGCKWSEKRNAWIAPTPAVHAQGQLIANAFWAANPNHDPWTPEGEEPVGQLRKKTRGAKATVIVDEAAEHRRQVGEAHVALITAEVLAKADDVQLVNELEKRGYVVRKVSESELLREALQAEGETGDHLLGAADGVFGELEEV